MIAFIVIVLLLIIACAVAPTAMQILLESVWWAIKVMFVLALIGGAIAWIVHL